MSEDAKRPPPFRPYVDMKTFMEHVLTPAAKTVWRVNGVVIDEQASTTSVPNPTRTGKKSSAAQRHWPRPPTR